MTAFLRKLWWLILRRSKEDELQEELQFHLDEEAGQHEAEGVSSDMARRMARREFGNVALVQEEMRAAWGWIFWEQILQDIRYALRTMSAHKTFSALVILSLALGIGANTAIFSFMDSILLRPLPVADPQSLVTLSWHTQRPSFRGSNRHAANFDDPKTGFIGGIFAYPAFELFQKNTSVFASVFGYQGTGDLNLIHNGQADLASGEYVTGDYFGGLGVRPLAGRLLTADDDRAGAAAVAVVTYAWSQNHFGGPAKTFGQSILINNIPFTVVGVTPPEFFGADPNASPDVYIPMHTNLLLEAGNKFFPPAGRYIDSNFDWVVIMARLHPGLSAARAEAALSAEFSDWVRSANSVRFSKTEFPTLVVRSGAGGLGGLRWTYSKPLYLLLALVGLILAIACANIANLLLARAATRKREIAVRLSMGAGRLRVIRQLLTESVLLALCGGALGVGVAFWGIRVLTLLLANGRRNFTMHAELNWHVLAAAAALSLLTGVLFGLAPAIQSTRVDLLPSLKESRTGERRSHLFRHLSLSHALVVSQIVFTMLVLVTAGLFVRTLSNLQSIQLGFNPQNVLTFQLNARQAGHSDPEIVAFYNDLRTRFAAIPGVERASLSDVPPIGNGTSGTAVGVVGEKPKGSSVLTVGAGFFSTMQIPILRGREIDERDRLDSPKVAVVNEMFAKSFFGNENPLGRRLTLPRECPKCEIEIVGVCGNSRYGDLQGNLNPIVYFPFQLALWGPVQEMSYELRTTGNPLGYARTVREIVHQADERLPVAALKTQGDLIDETIGQQITFAQLCSVFAFLALAIACVGLYGTLSYRVARRTGEIGLRIALGAAPGRVVWMVLREVFLLVTIGIAIGLPVARATSKLVTSFLYEIKPNDPLALIVATMTLVLAAIVAGYLPARHASRIDPLTALRHE